MVQSLYFLIIEPDKLATRSKSKDSAPYNYIKIMGIEPPFFLSSKRTSRPLDKKNGGYMPSYIEIPGIESIVFYQVAGLSSSMIRK